MPLATMMKVAQPVLVAAAISRMASEMPDSSDLSRSPRDVRSLSMMVDESQTGSDETVVWTPLMVASSADWAAGETPLPLPLPLPLP